MVDWSGKKVVIMGAARQGTSLARFLARHGARVVLNDQKPASALSTAQQALADETTVEWVCGGHPLDLLEGIDLLCLSGGIPLAHPMVVEARKRDIPLSNDSQIFLELCPCKVVGITGSAGKTTTTELVGRIAQAATPGDFRQVWVGGNIGSPLISSVEEIQIDDLAIVELSSFQLEIMTRSPQVAAVLNITPNHLDRHESMEAYTAAKARILEFQSKSDVAILGRDDPGAWSLIDMVRGNMLSFGLSVLSDDQGGSYLKDEAIYLRMVGTDVGKRLARQQGASTMDVKIMTRGEIGLRGEHNLLNAMAACTIAAAAGLSVESMRAGVEGFTGVPHRLEYILSWKGAAWYNDSIATAPERAMAAIRSFDEPLVLLAGGRDKKLPWEDFAALVRQRVDHLILFGEATETILKAFALTGEERFTVTCCAGLRDAVLEASRVVEPGDVVLLSPGGTSFDEFKDFEERGQCFAQWVKELV